MADISLILICTIIGYEIAARWRKVGNKPLKPFSCPSCMAFWIGVILFTILGKYELILPTHLIALFYANQRMF